jgi:hypothetical protein
MTTDAAPEIAKILRITSGLAPTEVRLFTDQIRGILEGLDADPTSSADAQLRIAIGAFLAGYELGRKSTAD